MRAFFGCEGVKEFADGGAEHRRFVRLPCGVDVELGKTCSIGFRSGEYFGNKNSWRSSGADCPLCSPPGHVGTMAFASHQAFFEAELLGMHEAPHGMIVDLQAATGKSATSPRMVKSPSLIRCDSQTAKPPSACDGPCGQEQRCRSHRPVSSADRCAVAWRPGCGTFRPQSPRTRACAD